MSVSNQTSEVQYSTNGSSKTFTITFPYLDETHIVVTYTNPSGVDTTLTLVTDYTIDEIIDGDVIQTFEVTTVATYPTGGKLTIQRIVPLTQETDYVENSSFPAESHEEALDKLTMAAQQLSAEINRALRLKATSTGVDAELPSPEADTFLGWNSTATGLTNLQSNAVPPNPTFTSVTTTDDINVGKDLTVGDKISSISVDCSSIATASIFVGALQGNALTATTATTATNVTNLPAGSIVQVVSKSYAFNFTTNSTSYVDIPDMSLSVTPKSNNNKILIISNIHGHMLNGIGQAYFKMLRNNTSIGALSGNEWYGQIGAYPSNIPFSFLDTPNTTSPITYKAQVITNGTVYINLFSGAMTLTILEVQG